MLKSKITTAATAVVLALLLIAGAIALPILIRPFYYIHIDLLGIPESTGLTEAEIRTAYDEMMDYCIGKRTEFSTGSLAWSEAGKSHFDDVSVLFKLDLAAAAICGALTACIFAAFRKKRYAFSDILGRGPFFWAAAFVGVPFAAAGILASLDFDRAFVIFHSIFFPGKTNWLFDYDLDQIIRILPQEFFRNCAIFILAVVVLGCAAFVTADVLLHKKAKASVK